MRYIEYPNIRENATHIHTTITPNNGIINIPGTA